MDRSTELRCLWGEVWRIGIACRSGCRPNWHLDASAQWGFVAALANLNRVAACDCSRGTALAGALTAFQDKCIVVFTEEDWEVVQFHQDNW